MAGELLALLVAMAFAAFALGTAPSALAQELADANCPGPQTGGPSGDGDDRFAQTFTAINTGKLTRAQAPLVKVTGTEDFVFAIHTVASGVPTDTRLAATLVLGDTVSGTYSLQEGAFAAPANVVAGQQYAFAVSRPGSDVASWAAAFRNGNPCAGVAYESESSAAPFSTASIAPGVDMLFAVFVTPSLNGTPSPNVSPSPNAPALTCNDQRATIAGTPGDDEIRGTDGLDVIAGLAGKDKILGLAGNDLICGGDGKDTLRGGKGKDKLLGQGGRDSLKGGGGRDLCRGGGGNDSASACEKERSL